MYLLEEFSDRDKYECKICGREFEKWLGLSKHVQQQSATHPELEEYKRLYFPRGYTKGISPNDHMLYMLCDPTIQGEYKYDIEIYGRRETLEFSCEPFYNGTGEMGTDNRCRHSAAYTDTKNQEKIDIINKLTNMGLKPIMYCIEENITLKTGKIGEKSIIPVIGRRNHPDPNRQGVLVNRSDGGDGYAAGELSATSRAQMGKSREGNKNRCDKWSITRKSDGEEIITEDLQSTCDELGLSRNRMRDVAYGNQKSHRGYTCKHVASRKKKG